MEELYCDLCENLTQHRFRSRAMTAEEEREADEQAIDEIGQEGIGGFLMAALLRSPPVRQGKKTAEEIWDTLGLGGPDISGKDIYECCECGYWTVVG